MALNVGDARLLLRSSSVSALKTLRQSTIPVRNVRCLEAVTARRDLHWIRNVGRNAVRRSVRQRAAEASAGQVIGEVTRPMRTLVVFRAFKLGSSTVDEAAAVGFAGLKPPADLMNWLRLTSFARAKWSPIRFTRR
jgi:hypothetical protein